MMGPISATSLRYNPATKTTVLVVATIFKVNTTPESSREDFLKLAFGMQKTALAASQLVNPQCVRSL